MKISKWRANLDRRKKSLLRVFVGWVFVGWVFVGWVFVGWVFVGWVFVGWVFVGQAQPLEAEACHQYYGALFQPTF